MTEDKHTAENLMSVVGEGETLPDDELLYDLADLFKTFGVPRASRYSMR